MKEMLSFGAPKSNQTRCRLHIHMFCKWNEPDLQILLRSRNSVIISCFVQLLDYMMNFSCLGLGCFIYLLQLNSHTLKLQNEL